MHGESAGGEKHSSKIWPNSGLFPSLFPFGLDGSRVSLGDREHDPKKK